MQRLDEQIGLPKGETHIGVPEEPNAPPPSPLEQGAIIVLCTLVLLGILAFFFNALTALIILLVANTLLHLLTQKMPQPPVIDIEVMFPGTAYLAAAHGFGYALAFIALAPLISEALDKFVFKGIWITIVSMLVTAIAAQMIGFGRWEVYAAAMIGLIVRMVWLRIIGWEPLLNLTRTISNAALSAVLVFIFIPLSA